MPTYTITSPKGITKKVNAKGELTSSEIDYIAQDIDKNFSDNQSFLEKSSNLVLGNTKKLGRLYGESLAAGTTAKEAQRQQQLQQGQNDIILKKMKEAQQTGNTQEYNRLKGLLGVNVATFNPDELTQEFAKKRNESIKAGIGAAIEAPSLITTVGGLAGSAKATKGLLGQKFISPNVLTSTTSTLGKAIASGAAIGAGQGLANTEAELITAQDKAGDIGKAAFDTAIGGVIGGTVGAVAYGAGKLLQKAADGIKSFTEKKAITPSKTLSVEVPKQIDYQSLSDKEKRKVQNEITDFFINNDISVPRQRGKALRPQQTFLEIQKQLTEQGIDINTIDAQDILDMSSAITGDNGATTRAVREMVASIDHPININIKDGDKLVDPINKTLEQTIRQSNKIRTDSALVNDVKLEINDILDSAKIDMNTYDPAKLFDAQKAIEKLQAAQQTIVNRSYGNTTNASLQAEQYRNIYANVADEIAQMIDNVTVDDGILQAGKNNLAQFYLDQGNTRLAQKTAAAKSLSQLRSTVADWVRMAQTITEGQEAQLSTFNKNTNLQNRLSNQLRGTAGDIYRTVNTLTRGQLDRSISRTIDETSRTTQKSLNKGTSGFTQGILSNLAQLSRNTAETAKSVMPVAAAGASRFTIERK